MPDTTTCVRHDCPKRRNCRRSSASGTVPGERQDWFCPPEIGEACPHFMPVVRLVPR